MRKFQNIVSKLSNLKSCLVNVLRVEALRSLYVRSISVRSIGVRSIGARSIGALSDNAAELASRSLFAWQSGLVRLGLKQPVRTVPCFVTCVTKQDLRRHQSIMGHRTAA
jgi:hypothetical protein